MFNLHKSFIKQLIKIKNLYTEISNYVLHSERMFYNQTPVAVLGLLYMASWESHTALK